MKHINCDWYSRKWSVNILHVAHGCVSSFIRTPGNWIGLIGPEHGFSLVKKENADFVGPNRTGPEPMVGSGSRFHLGIRPNREPITPRKNNKKTKGYVTWDICMVSIEFEWTTQCFESENSVYFFLLSFLVLVGGSLLTLDHLSEFSLAWMSNFVVSLYIFLWLVL